MLRYQKFEMGRLWTTEYGSAEKAQDLSYLLKYSPYQNVKPGPKYPAIMFFTGDSDTRVRSSARAQDDGSHAGRRWGRPSPSCCITRSKAGIARECRSAQLVADQADELAFLWNETSGISTSNK